MKLIFATGNPGKLREAREILGPHGIEVISPYDLGLTPEQVDVEETGSTFEENAIIKVRHLRDLTGMPCFADDSGLVVDALGGAPG
ncbi:MAG: non-canonical purine NTP pyrophosphatase, partial [Bacteroidales bacterium]|nr:non-canonical purine NTP pyrophosphatase [Bacteroidales bacterium]